MKHPGAIRDRLFTRVIDMLEHLRIQLSMYHPDEIEVLSMVERPQQFDLAVEVTDAVMGRLGHKVSDPKDPRFSKTRRAIRRRNPESDARGNRRGVLSEEDRAILSGQKEP